MGNLNNSAALIAVDWGTTNVRVALLDVSGKVLDERRGESGVGHFSAQQFEQRFDELTADWPMVPAIAAGMIGSRQGWREADYIACPASLKNLADALHTFDYNGRSITIIPGIKLDDGKRFDVMRGEESQLTGFLAKHSDFTGCVIMPGTHSKWVTLENGTVSDFRTYMTGEIFEALSEHSILKHSVMADDGGDEYFSAKSAQIAEDKQSLEGELFGLRARHLLEGCATERLRQELSAALIMAELQAGIQDGFILANPVYLIGTENLTSFYEIALRALGYRPLSVRGTSLVWPALFHLAGNAGIIRTENP